MSKPESLPPEPERCCQAMRFEKESRFTHDRTGKPLPEWILNGSVAYAPIKPKPRTQKK